MNGSPMRAAVVETHSAVLFFVGERVYKAKKPVDLGFLDFSTVESRRVACERECSLNQRLAPDVYEGVATLQGPDGEAWDHLVVMRRMPDQQRLGRRVQRGDDVTAAVEEVAEQIAELHRRSPTVAEMSSVASVDGVRLLWADGFDAMSPHVGTWVAAGQQERIEHLVDRYLGGRAGLFERRIADGHLVDGHGDLQAEDIFCTDDGVRILDCLEFDDRLRWGDALSDLAFLAMDLERLGRRDLADRLMARYRERSSRTWPVSLEHHYIAYRAHVRAKVGVIRDVQTGTDSGDVDTYQRLCLDHLEAARIRLVLVGGLPGTGKSTLARALGDRFDAVVLRTDEMRRQLPGAVGYDAGSVDAVYDEMLRRASDLLSAGEQVVLDASWSSERHRAGARRVAADTVSELLELRTVAPAAVAAARIEHRRSEGIDPSEATAQVAADMSERFDPWHPAVELRTDRSTDDVAADAVRLVSG